MEKFDLNIDQYFIDHGLDVTMELIFKMAISVVDALEIVHSALRTYNDLKPQNVMVQQNSKEELIFLIDFGFCQKFVTQDGKHISHH